jgi:hypothetical protein
VGGVLDGRGVLRVGVVLIGHSFRGVSKRDEGPQLGPDLEFLLSFVEAEGDDGEVVEEPNVVREHIDGEVVAAFVFSVEGVVVGIVLHAFPVENHIGSLESELELIGERFIFGSDRRLIFVEGFRSRHIAFFEE